MKKKWALIGVVITAIALLGLWIDGKKNIACTTCAQKEPPFFQLFSIPTADREARQKKFSSFIEQSYPLFRVAVTAEEAAYPDVQAILEKFPVKFAKLAGTYHSQELLYRWMHSIPSQDIIVLFPSDGVLNPSALDRLKTLYEGSAAWVAFQGNIKQWAQQGVLTGYAHLFQRIKLQDFLEEGLFSSKKTPEIRLFELAGRHVRRLRGNFIEGKSYGYSWIARSRKPYPRFRPGQESPNPQSDLVIFSFDRPLQLYALLESVYQFMTSLGEVAVIYRVSSSDYEKGYEIVKKQFPNVRYLKQGDQPLQDFKPLVLQATFQSPSSYVMFAVDDMVVRDFIDVKEGILAMERIGAWGVHYCLGHHIDFSYMTNKAQSIPPSIWLEKDLWAWQFSGAEGDWRYPHSVDMTLYKKEDIKSLLTSLNYIHPNSLESRWALKAKKDKVGIYYATSKVVNIPLNIINPSDSRHRSEYTTQELLTMFLQGLKLDIKPFQGYRNRSAHIDNIPMSFVLQNETKN